ncbi:MAG: hypothetical protein ACLVL6_14015 [Clostridium paraputrificum]
MAVKRLSAVTAQALKEALCNIYWYKNDLRSFLEKCIYDKNIIIKLNWGNYKRQIVSDVVDLLYDDQEKYLGDLRRLVYEVCNMNDFVHLQQLEDGYKKAQKAKEAVSVLKGIVNKHNEKKKEDEDIMIRRKEAAEKLKSNQAVVKKLEEINSRYSKLILSGKPQQRGFELEKIMYDIFSLFDLDPKASFRNIGEQIDGAFELEGTDYLFEAKWQSTLSDASDLDSFCGKIRRKLDNTLGLFMSINGFSEDAVKIHSAGRSTILLMDGADLMAVLEGRIDLVTLIIRKKRHAAHTGNIYLKINEVLYC